MKREHLLYAESQIGEVEVIQKKIDLIIQNIFNLADEAITADEDCKNNMCEHHMNQIYTYAHILMDYSEQLDQWCMDNNKGILELLEQIKEKEDTNE